MYKRRDSKEMIRVILPIFIAVFCFFILSSKLPQIEWIQNALESIEQGNRTVMEFTGATTATSLALSALPNDFATPLANTLAGMNKYCIFILIVLFIERLMIIQGIKIACMFIIPSACICYIASHFIKGHMLGSFLYKMTYKLAVLGIAVILVVPCSTHFANYVGDEYLSYVDTTISETNVGADTINGIMQEDDDDNFFDKISNFFDHAIKSVSDLMDYFKNVIKKCMNSIAILTVTTFVIPVLTTFFFKWLLNELFAVVIPIPELRRRNHHHHPHLEKKMEE